MANEPVARAAGSTQEAKPMNKIRIRTESLSSSSRSHSGNGEGTRSTPKRDLMRAGLNRSPYGRAASVVAVLVAVLVMISLAPPVRAAASPTPPGDALPPPPIDGDRKSFDGTFSSGLRREVWRDPAGYKVAVMGPPTVIAVPPYAHDSVEVDLTISRDEENGEGINLSVAVSAPGGPAPGPLDFVGIFGSGPSNSTEHINNVRLTWDHRVAPAQTMNLHVRCTTPEPELNDACAISNIRGFEDTPGGWDPIAWNGPTEHGFGVYAQEMPLVVGDRNYGPRITSDGAHNPFLGVERSLRGEEVKLRGPLVTLPTFTQQAPLTASIRWRRTTTAVAQDSPKLTVRFMPIDAPATEEHLIAIAPSYTTLDWQTATSAALPTRISGKVGHFLIVPDNGSLGPIQAVGLDSLTFSLNGQPVDIPLTPCTPGPNNVVIYERPFYQGRCVVRGIGEYKVAPLFTPLLDNSASSIRVGANVEAELFDLIRLTGEAEVFAGDDNDFSNNALGDDTMSSFKVRARTVGTQCTDGPISFGEIQAAGCFTHPTPTVWEATGTVRVNGIDLTTAGTITLNAAEASLSVSGQVDVSVGEGANRMVLYAGADLEWDLSVELSLALPENFTLKGFPVTGEAKITWSRGETQAELTVGLPKLLGGVSAEATLSANMAVGLKLDSVSIALGETKIGPRLTLKNLALKYEFAKRTWKGDGKVVLPSDIVVEVDFVFTDGEFVEGNLAVTAINKPLGAGVFLDSIGFGVKAEPFELNGSAAITAGPKVNDTAAATIAGELSYTFADPDIFKVGGTLRLVELDLASGSIEYVMPDKLNMEGKLEFDQMGITVTGELEGWIDGARAFNIEGSAAVQAFGWDIASAKAVVSSVGMAACGSVWVPWEVSIGVGYKWGEEPDFGKGCDLGPYVQQPLPLAGFGGYRLSDGLPVAAFAVTGESAPPTFTLVGPNGERVEATRTGSDPRGYLVVMGPENNTTYVVLGRPAAGNWTIEAHKESSPITSVRRSDGLPKPKVDGTVRMVPNPLCLTCPAQAQLTWTVSPLPGQTVTFAEVSDQTSRIITTADPASGSVTFTPGPGEAGTRQVVALVEQDGLPRTNLAVATF
jgi:hypothetical protein